MLRLLAFPGTNVQVYGAIENEFSKYSCKMLEGACGALEDFANCLRTSAGSDDPVARKRVGLDGNDGWEIVDVPATYKRAMVYKNRVLGVFLEVLHCLLEEDGQGCDSRSPRVVGDVGANIAGSDGNGFYHLGCKHVSGCKDTCKRNLCCERKTSNNGEHHRLSSGDMTNIEGIPLDTMNSMNRSPSSNNNSGTLDAGNRFTTTTTTTIYGNNPLMGDIGNMTNLSTQAKSDGKELYLLLTSILHELSMLELSASNIVRIVDSKQQLKKATVSKETVQCATRVVERVGELREFVPRINITSPDTDTADTDEQQHDEESEVGAEAVRNRLEETGGTSASTSGSNMGMIYSAAQAFKGMIDPPPHNCIFGLDVIRGSFLARYRGARQFWVRRGASGGMVDVIMIPSSASNNNKESEVSSPSMVESFLPLSPRKGRENSKLLTPLSSIVGSGGNNNVGKKRKAVLYCNPNAGLVEVATGMGLTGGNVVEDDGKDDEDREP